MQQNNSKNFYIHKELLQAPFPPQKDLTYTLASQFSLMLQMAEYLFGERDRSFAFLGFEFINASSRIALNRKNKEAIIQLATGCLADPIAAYASLAHETIHLIAPQPNYNDKPIVLEEGLAVFYAEIYMMFVHGITIPEFPEIANYHRACLLFKELIKLDSWAIKKLRQEQPVISYIDKKLILKHYPQLPEEIAEELTQEFVYLDNQVELVELSSQSNPLVS